MPAVGPNAAASAKYVWKQEARNIALDKSSVKECGLGALGSHPKSKPPTMQVVLIFTPFNY